MSAIRVGVVGASGETGTSITNGLLECATKFQVTALVRAESYHKKSNQNLLKKGVKLQLLDLSAPIEDIAKALGGLEVLICALGMHDQLRQIPLVSAARLAGVRRFLPCAYVPVMAPNGVHALRDQKEIVYNHIKKEHMSYTIVDCGWWYQISFPPLPSGKIDYALGMPNQRIAGDGTVKSALTDLRDVGRYVALVAHDDRTIDKYVFVYNELFSDNDVYGVLEEMSGESLSRDFVSLETLQTEVASAQEVLQNKEPSSPQYFQALVSKVSAQYMISKGILGENTPQYAEYLGYVTSKSLYPDFKFIKYTDYMEEVLSGRATIVYEELRAQFAMQK